MKFGSISRLLFGLFVVAWFSVSLPASAEVLKIVVDDTIHPVTEEYISRALAEAERNKDQALLVEINTPGGLLDSTRHIIEKILASPVPVIIYVTPSGSRAASAGFFISGERRRGSHGSGHQYGRCSSGDPRRRQSGRRDEGEDGE